MIGGCAVYKAGSPEKQTDEAGLTQVNPDPVARGQEAWGRLKKGLADWFAVAEALQHGQHLAMLESHSNEPKGSRFQVIMGEWLRTTGFDEIDKGVRSRLLNLFKHRAEIEAWHKALPTNKRQQLAHPNAVWRAWQKSTVTGHATVTRHPSPATKYKDEIARLEDENYRLRSVGDDLFLAQDTAVDIAQVLVDRLVRLTPTKAKQILELVPELYAKRSAETPYEKARSRTRKKRRTVEDFQRDLAAKKAAGAKVFQ
jgi:hypothetical protein